jgi:hypothetical protein
MYDLWIWFHYGTSNFLKFIKTENHLKLRSIYISWWRCHFAEEWYFSKFRRSWIDYALKGVKNIFATCWNESPKNITAFCHNYERKSEIPILSYITGRRPMYVDWKFSGSIGIVSTFLYVIKKYICNLLKRKSETKTALRHNYVRKSETSFSDFGA